MGTKDQYRQRRQEAGGALPPLKSDSEDKQAFYNEFSELNKKWPKSEQRETESPESHGNDEKTKSFQPMSDAERRARARRMIANSSADTSEGPSENGKGVYSSDAGYQEQDVESNGGIFSGIKESMRRHLFGGKKFDEQVVSDLEDRKKNRFLRDQQTNALPRSKRLARKRQKDMLKAEIKERQKLVIKQSQGEEAYIDRSADDQKSRVDLTKPQNKPKEEISSRDKKQARQFKESGASAKMWDDFFERDNNPPDEEDLMSRRDRELAEEGRKWEAEQGIQNKQVEAVETQMPDREKKDAA